MSKTPEERAIKKEKRKNAREKIVADREAAEKAEAEERVKNGVVDSKCQMLKRKGASLFCTIDRAKMATIALLFSQGLVLLQNSLKIPDYTADFLAYGSCGGPYFLKETGEAGSFTSKNTREYVTVTYPSCDSDSIYPGTTDTPVTFSGFCDNACLSEDNADKEKTCLDEENEDLDMYRLVCPKYLFEKKPECGESGCSRFMVCEGARESSLPSQIGVGPSPSMAPTYQMSSCRFALNDEKVHPSSCSATYGDLDKSLKYQFSPKTATVIVSTFATLQYILIFATYHVYNTYLTNMEKYKKDPTHIERTKTTRKVQGKTIETIKEQTWKEIADDCLHQSYQLYFGAGISGYMGPYFILAVCILGIMNAKEVSFGEGIQVTCPEFVKEASAVKSNVFALCGFTIFVSILSIIVQMFSFYDKSWLDEFVFEPKTLDEAIKSYLKAYVQDKLAAAAQSIELSGTVMNVLGGSELVEKGIEKGIDAASDKVTETVAEKIVDKGMGEDTETDV